MESNQKDLFNKVCYLQGYLDCLTNIDSDGFVAQTYL